MEVQQLSRVEPELGVSFGRSPELQNHFGTHRCPSVDDPVDDLHVVPEMIRQTSLGHAKRRQEFLAETPRV